MAYRKINIDFSNLPMYSNKKINWNICKGESVKYEIDGTNYCGNIKIEDVYDKKLKIKIDGNEPIIIYKSSFKECKIAKEFGIKSKYFKYSIGEEINDILILEQRIITSEVFYNGIKIPSEENGYFVRCLRDGYEFEVLEKVLNRRRNCPVCGNAKVVPGINDIGTTDPDFAKWFVNKDDILNYTRNTNKEVLLKCPVCGRTFVGIPNRYKSLPSCICNDHISYPEKVMASVLNQLQVRYIYQLNNSHFKWCKTYRYDFYFEYKSKKYIVEMDGAFHYMYNYKNDMSVEESNKIDNIKDQLAKENNCILIRINCNYDDFGKRHEFIKNNILNSYFAKIFDLSDINWKECENFAITSLIKTVSDLWNDGMTKVEIKDKTKLSKTTIDEYLKIGKSLKLNEYIPGARHHISDSGKKYIKIQDENDNILCMHFGITDFSRKSNQLMGYKIGSHQIYDSLKNKTQNKKGLIFSYATKEEYEDYINKEAS